MTKSLPLISIGGSVGLILPHNILSRLKITVGDVLYLTDTPNGFELRTFDSEYAEDMEIAERVMREDYEVLKKLADQCRIVV